MPNLSSLLRQQVRQLRQQLTPQQQQQAAQDLLKQCLKLPVIQHSQHIALYLANDGELDTQPLIRYLWQQNKQVYLPVLHPFCAGHLLFLHYTAHSPMQANRYGILEPKLIKNAIQPLANLDLIFTPLVAFDAQGNRLGMGGGYYDRTLSQWLNLRPNANPIGIAHDCQQLPHLQAQPWDIALNTLITPSRIWQW